MAWYAIGSTVVSAGVSLYSANKQKKATDHALDEQKQLAANLKYEPIDIEKLKADATANAISNATQSLAIERELQPNVAATREELARQTNEQLALGGKLGTDTINTVNKAGRTLGSRSGVGFGNTVPLTAGLLGLSSIDIANQRRAAAGSLLSNNPLPAAGLDPGTIASYEVANNAAYNDFNAAKAGVDSKLVQGEANAQAAQIGSQAGAISSLVGALGKNLGDYYKNKPPSTYADTLSKVPKTASTYYNQNASTNPLMSSGMLT